MPRPRFDNVNLILGVNGAGKSTLLDGIALGVLSPIIAQAGFRPHFLIRRGPLEKHADRATLDIDMVVHRQDGLKKGSEARRRVATSVERRGDVERIVGYDDSHPIWEGMFSEESPAFLIVGYGATRRVESSANVDTAARSRARQLRYERVASLFEEQFTLRPLTSWLPEWSSRNPGRHKQVVNLINRLSGEDVRFTGVLERGEYVFRTKRTDVPFSALSDGYKAFIGWVGDLLYHVCMGCPKGMKLVDNKGVVLVDEIDLHIHPKWQRTIIPTLARALPNMQFVFTSHSPLVVGTLERANIHLIETNRLGRPVLRRPDEEIYGLSADQILRSDVFGLESTRDPSFKAHLDALSGEAAIGDREAAMTFMRQVAQGQGAALPEEPSEPPEWVRRLAARST
ncbi:AAA family ATPase [Methylobacterium brachythecii]|uniref:AAA family ATPase n=1 Tax=Methylobacterium brachythecii TaxID=1176177 RepID=UPI001FE51F94|nr:AAA family ATPase [Methylobacterium brachythecii]